MRASILLLLILPLPVSAQIFIGTNPSGNADYTFQNFTADIPLRFPGQLGSPWNADNSISVAGSGAVTAPNGFGTYLEGYNYPNAAYTLTFTATNPQAAVNGFTTTGIMKPNGAAIITGNTVKVPLNLQHDSGGIKAGSGWFGFTSAGGTYGDVHLTANSLSPYGLTPFGISYLSNTQAVRFMDLAGVNQDTTSHPPADIPALTNGFATGYAKQIQWANAAYTATGKLRNITVNIPVNANDAYVKAVADLFRDNLNSNIQVKMELANENWNTATFAQAGYILNLSKSDNRLQGSDDFGRQGQEAGILAFHAAQIFENEFTAQDRARLRVAGVMGGQGTNTYFAQKMRQGITEVFGVNASTVLPYESVSVYPGDFITSASSVQDLFNQVRSDFNRQATGMQQAKADDLANGQILDVYEWSPKAYLTRGSVDSSIVNAANTDPGMVTLTDDIWNQIIKPNLMAGSTAYAFDGPGTGWGSQVDPSLLPNNPDSEWSALYGTNGLVAQQVAADSVPEPSLLLVIGLILMRRRR